MSSYYPGGDGNSLPPSMPTGPSPPQQHPSDSPAPSLSQPPSPSAPTVNTPPPLLPTEAPSPRANLEEFVFGCTDDGVVLVDPPYEAMGGAKTVQFKVGYLVESVGALEEFESDLELMILQTAVIGALECNTGGSLFGPGGNGASLLTQYPMSTRSTGEQCAPQFPGTACTVLESEFVVAVVDIEGGSGLDSTTASFWGYVFLQQEMDGGSFLTAIPLLDRCKYLRPLPLLPPIVGVDDPSPSPGGSQEDPVQQPLGVSQWTLGAVLAMCKCVIAREGHIA